MHVHADLHVHFSLSCMILRSNIARTLSSYCMEQAHPMVLHYFMRVLDEWLQRFLEIVMHTITRSMTCSASQSHLSSAALHEIFC